jgi:hypothetical protein
MNTRLSRNVRDTGVHVTASPPRRKRWQPFELDNAFGLFGTRNDILNVKWARRVHLDADIPVGLDADVHRLKTQSHNSADTTETIGGERRARPEH